VKTFALKRLLISVPLVFVMTFVMFVIVNWTGATKFDSFENDPSVDPQIIEMEKRRLGIYEPVPVRYFYWLQGVFFDIRFIPERRYIASFEDNDPEKGDDRYRYGGTEIRRPLAGVSGDYDVQGETGVPFGALAGSKQIVALLDRKAVESVELTAGPGAPAGLAVIVVTGTGVVPFPFKAKDGSAPKVTIRLDDLNRQAAIAEIREFRLDAEKPGKATIEAVAIKRRVWQETYPGRAKKRTIQALYTGQPDEYAELGTLKSPYTSKPPEGSDWAADWGAALRVVQDKFVEAEKTWTDGGKKGPQPEPSKIQEISFDRLEFEARALEGGPLPVSLLLLHGDKEKPVATKVADLELVSDTRTMTVDIAAIPKDVDLHQVRGLRLACSRPGRAEFDDFRLRAGGSPFHVGAPNFGKSWDKKKDVLALIGEKVKNTIVLNLWALLIVWMLALPIGIYGAVRQYSTSEKVISFMTFIGMAMPSFFLAILVVFIVSLTYEIPADSRFSFLREILPIAGRTSQNHSEMSFLGQMKDLARHMILPTMVGVLGGVGGLQRVLRGTMLEERRKLYITTAMAKGLPPWKVLYKHALRNAIIPFVASSGSILPGRMAGSAFVEIVFDYPGIGRQMLESVTSYDIPVVMANLLIAGLLLVVGNLLADIGLALVDPRISVEG